ncbi:MAG: dihydroorotate dehydrogenase [Defluviitaleaceae bacterium]|nr:dihydroorotate dehydrogenase [Defluviitaleaceae bacterium]
MIDLSVNIAGLKLKNPVMTASGTFASGKEYNQFFDVSALGAIVTKGVSYEPWQGNKTPRIAETHGGMLNSIGLENKGFYKFAEEDVPFLKDLNTHTIVNLCGKTIEEYVKIAKAFNEVDGIDAYELNISCPNIKEGGMAFGTDPKAVDAVVRAVKKELKAPLIVKLSPNVTDITLIAKTAQEAGADAISMINTLGGMQIDIKRKKPILSTTYGGLSGPAIKPVAVAMVHKVAQVVDIPIIGMGGISTAEDAIEFLMAGATAIAVGTANFANPTITLDIIAGIENYMRENNLNTISQIKM